MTPEQFKPVDPVLTWHLQIDQEQAGHYVSKLIKTNKNPQISGNVWFPTPENPGNPDEHTPIQKNSYVKYGQYKTWRHLIPQRTRNPR